MAHITTVRLFGFGLGLVILAAALTGCGTGKVKVVLEPKERLNVSSVQVVEGTATTAAPLTVRRSFERKLAERLVQRGFEPGEELTVKYRFIDFSPGDQFERMIWGNISDTGKGTMTVEVTYFNGNSEVLGKVLTEGAIERGAFGGSFDEALDGAATKIAAYTAKNYR